MRCFTSGCIKEADWRNELRIGSRTVCYCKDCFEIVKTSLGTLSTQRLRQLDAWARRKQKRIKKRRIAMGGM